MKLYINHDDRDHGRNSLKNYKEVKVIDHKEGCFYWEFDKKKKDFTLELSFLFGEELKEKGEMILYTHPQKDIRQSIDTFVHNDKTKFFEKFNFLKKKQNATSMNLEENELLNRYTLFAEHSSKELYSFSETFNFDLIKVVDYQKRDHFVEVTFHYSDLTTIFIVHLDPNNEKIFYIQSVFPMMSDDKTMTYIESSFEEEYSFFNEKIINDLTFEFGKLYRLRWLFDR